MNIFLTFFWWVFITFAFETQGAVSDPYPFSDNVNGPMQVEKRGVIKFTHCHFRVDSPLNLKFEGKLQGSHKYEDIRENLPAFMKNQREEDFKPRTTNIFRTFEENPLFNSGVIMEALKEKIIMNGLISQNITLEHPLRKMSLSLTTSNSNLESIVFLEETVGRLRDYLVERRHLDEPLPLVYVEYPPRGPIELHPIWSDRIFDRDDIFKNRGCGGCCLEAMYYWNNERKNEDDREISFLIYSPLLRLESSATTIPQITFQESEPEEPPPAIVQRTLFYLQEEEGVESAIKEYISHQLVSLVSRLSDLMEEKTSSAFIKNGEPLDSKEDAPKKLATVSFDSKEAIVHLEVNFEIESGDQSDGHFEDLAQELENILTDYETFYSDSESGSYDLYFSHENSEALKQAIQNMIDKIEHLTNKLRYKLSVKELM